MAALAMLAAMALDSESMLPMGVLVICEIYFVIFIYANRKGVKHDKNEDRAGRQHSRNLTGKQSINQRAGKTDGIR